MNEKIKGSIAASMETETKMLPYLPYLIQDLWVLGSSVDQILSGIESLNLPKKTAVLDLCCGKGGVSVQIAQKFGFKVTGIDVMTEFLNIAKKKASEFNVIHLCDFIKQDVHDYVKNSHEFDIVILGAAGSIFGDLEKTIGVLRSQLKEGGYLFLDDGYLKKVDRIDRKGYEYYLNYEKSKAALVSYNDRIVAEINTSEVSKSINFEYQKLIEKRGSELIRLHPEMKNEIRKYLNGQAEECHILDSEIEGVLWIIQKTNI